MNSIDAFYPYLATPASFVITTHQKPDGDAMGSSLGLYHFLLTLGHQVTVISPTNWASFLNWMPACDLVIDFEKNKEKCVDIINNAAYIFCLDFNTLSRIKHMEPYIAAAAAKKILIDHHEQPQTAAFDYGISQTAKSSTCEMVYDFIMASGYANNLNLTSAQCIYAGTMTDTGSFRFASTTASVHTMVAHLKQMGLAHTVIHDHIYDSSLENRLRFLGYVLQHCMEIYYEYNTALIVITKQDLLKYKIQTGDTEGLVNYPLSIIGITMAAIVIDREDERKWSFRSKGNIDVNTFARTNFDGGGHFNAAGGRSTATLEETVNKFKHLMEVNNQKQ
jgi:bifunctional oligoribonuclease and PAP phosphatase NrnA